MKKSIIDDAEAAIQDEIDTLKMRTEAKRKQESTYLRDTNKKLLLERDVAEQKIAFVLDIQNRESQRFVITPKKSTLDNEAVSVMTLSDIHIEERVDPSTVNGLNEYNPDIAAASVMQFFRNGLRLHQIFQRDVKIDTILLNLLGDIITGYIHEELMEDNYLSPTQATMLAMDVLSTGIKFLLKGSKTKLVIPCVVGNHGRTTEKMRISTSYKNSFEWMMYHSLAREFKNEERVHFIIENGYMTYVDVLGYMLRLHHGNAIKYQDGIGGITVPVNKAISQWDKERRAYLDVFGHHHTQMMDAGKFCSNGSVIGYSPYAVKIRAPFQKPMQSFFLIDKKRGKSICAPIFVR